MLSLLKFKSEFNRNVFSLMSGTILAQAIPIAISPILTRIYKPEDFGLFALYTSILMIFSSLASGKYELSILIPSDNKDAKILVLLSFCINLFFSFVLFVFILFFYKENSMLANINLGNWMYITPINIFFLSGIFTLYQYNNRKKNYDVLRMNSIVQSLVQGFLNIMFAMITYVKGGLILGTFFGNIVSFLYLYYQTRLDFKKNNCSRKKLKSLSKKYVNFPKFVLPSNLLENISSQLPFFMIEYLYNSHALGLFSLSQRIIRIPIGIIGNAVVSVFRQEAAEQLNNSGDCRKLFITTLRNLIIVSTIPFVVFFFIAPDLFRFVFGEGWYEAGVYAQILSILFYIQFIVSPLSSILIIAEKQKYDLMLQVYLVISVCISFIFGYIFFMDIKYSLCIFVALYSIKYMIELSLSYRFTIIRGEVK